MKHLTLGLYIFFLFFIEPLKTSEDCSEVHKKRRTSSSQRYQPKSRNCHDCDPQHKHLFLMGFNVFPEKLRRCAIEQDIDEFSLANLTAETLILVLPSHDLHPEPYILDLIVHHLGNVSIFLSGQSSGRILRHCRSLGPMCHRLDNLLPVIRQIRHRNSVNVEVDVSQALLDLYNVKHLPGNPNVTKMKPPTIHRQFDQLFGELCKRDHKLNMLLEVSQSTLDKNSVETALPSSEASLILSDILPINQKTYDKNRAPKILGQPTIVYFHVTVLSLDSINEESMTYVADVFLAQSWRDPRLRLPESMSEEYRILDVEWLRDIWRPDCFFKNAKQVTFHEMSVPNHYLWLYHDKTLLYMSKLTLVLSCAMKFESYPHDTQVCSIMIESLSHTTHDLVFIWNITDPLVVNPEIELPQLDIANNYTTDCTLTYSTGNFTCLAVVFTLRRRLGYHLFHTYIPSALIVVMSWISFWIKPEAIPARVTLGVTSLLTLATQNTQSQQSLPPVSYVKAIDVWMSSCSVFVFLSLMEFAIVNNYMGPVATKAMKGFSDEDISSDAGDFHDQRKARRSSAPAMPQYTICYGKETAIYIDKFSRFFFPFSFFILNVVYWSTFL